jgi:hypothetical protein
MVDKMMTSEESGEVVMFTTIDDIKAANLKTGQKWFDPGTMAFFSSQIERKVYQGCYFISSEQYELSDTQRAKGKSRTPRRWTIRIVTPHGWVHTMGEFQQYKSLQAAEEAVAFLPPCGTVVVT